jgi:hypothetical protein
MLASQARARQVFGVSEPPPGSRRAGLLTFSHKYAKWFLRLAALCLLVGALVMVIVIVA